MSSHEWKRYIAISTTVTSEGDLSRPGKNGRCKLIKIWIANQLLILFQSFAPNFVRLIGPVIEKVSPNEPAFLSEDPLKIILSGNYQHVPLIMGYNSREGLFFKTESNRFHDDTNANFEDYIPHNLKAKKGSAFSRSIAKKMEEFYFGGEYSPSKHQDKLCLVIDLDFLVFIIQMF